MAAAAIMSRRACQTHLPLRFFSSLTLSPAVRSSSATSSSPNLNLDDTEKLYASVPTGDLLSSLGLLYTMAVGPAVDLGMAVMRSPAVMEKRLLRAAVVGVVRRTVYRQFCAGEDAGEVGRRLGRLWESGLRAIVNYGMEDAEDDTASDRNLAGFVKTVEMTAEMPPDSVSFACVKITAICPIPLLERISDLLRWEKKHPSFHLPWKRPSLPILTNFSLLHHPLPAPPPSLTSEEELQLQLAHSRLLTLCKRCAESNLPLLVDAEYASVQPAIEYMTYSAALEFNTTAERRRPIVYGTMQCYLKDAKERLVQAVEAAESAGISIGFKLVRGAYLSRESVLAKSLGVASPIHETIEETHNCYNDCAAFMLERMLKGSASVVLATHNFDSGRAAAAKAEELGIGKGDQRLQFAQLMGMGDGLSLGLRNAGFQVSKYVPFGPVEQVIPYLLRRAQENRGFLSTSTLDRQLIMSLKEGLKLLL
ncbi:proline dehydrogenase 1, mitochondrial-like isoform X2 [Phalaenopsis equestris]|uniref:proline dehydrogenase 1, mitochondrial-like isoform X2 n=1 Tax=Phalaenopsis equestris TaxID=78828 RepID=UPI0009E2CC86|nr:proline dehydrogenase 1, mitochondrial-like isoform X2 [Phalaenopsis equestris]